MLPGSSRESLTRIFKSFKYRFTTGEELAGMLYGIKRVVERHGSLQACFVNAQSDDHETIIPALAEFVKELSAVFESRPSLPSPRREAQTAEPVSTMDGAPR
jgi:hypothetical protein